MKRTRSGWWLIRPRMFDDARSLAASVVLIALGLFVRGPIGLIAVAVFGLIAVIVTVRLMRRETVASLDPEGLTIHRNMEATSPLRRLWTQIDGVLIWTNQGDDGQMVDVLTVVTGLDETFTSVDSEMLTGRRMQAVSAQRTSTPDVLTHSVPLDGCVVDLFDLRAALVGFGCDAPVVDQRITL